MAVLTQAFTAIVIDCAPLPPLLDVIYNPEFNVLNPGLLAVGVGILASRLAYLFRRF